MNTILLFMKRNYKALILIGVFVLAFWSFIPKNNKIDVSADADKDKMLLELILRVLEEGHYEKIQIDDEFSKKLYTSYLDVIDPQKRHFLQSDIDEFSKFEKQLDDQTLNRDISFFDLTYNRLMQRMEESKAYYKEILDKPFDFSKDEDFNLDFEKQPYSKNSKELKDRWRKQIKLSVLSRIYDNEKIQKEVKEKSEKEKDNSDKNSEKEPIEIKSLEQLEKEARETELKNFNDFFDFMNEQDRDDWFSIYLNAIAEQIDPHTNYMAPNDKEKFETGISGKFEGIGARLMKKGDLIEVSELISGGPAWREGKLENGDLIMKVAQENEETIDIAGMKMDNVVKMIKGKKGTKVILTVKKVDGTITDIPITRDVVELEETYARSTIVEKQDKKYGIVYLPKFYFDMQDKKARDAAKDVAKEIEYLKDEKIEGLIIDLRNNGGGSLRAAVEISGLFIEKGPIVQVKNPSYKKYDGTITEGKIEVFQDRDPSVLWDGPLVVMVNSFSASASEIFAAAMQDYKRAIIIGSNQTYGKGTVQNIAILNNFVRNTDIDFGAIKVTTQKFYRINGGSTQLEGVKSDIVLPDRYVYIDMGEKDMKNAMNWDEIPPANYTPVATSDVFAQIIEKSKQRIEQNQYFKLIDQNAKWIAKQREDYDYSLNYDKFTKKEEELTQKRKEFDQLKEYKNSFTFNLLPYELEQIKTDTILGKKRKRWHENLAKDIYTEEAINILEDWNNRQASLFTKTKK